jgi:hypothetical protein
MKKQRHHVSLRMKTRLLLLENRLKNCFDSFEKVNGLKITVLKQSPISI